MPKIIGPFINEYAYLSNFFIESDGTHVEGEFQAQKTYPPTEWLKVVSPFEAKRCGRKLKLREDWDSVKIRIMQDLVRKKFQDHPELADKLCYTYRCELVEINHWCDTFWGVYNGHGMNWLGRILMSVRDVLNQEPLPFHQP